MFLTPSRILWLLGSAAALLLISIVIAISPVQIQLTLTPKAPEAQAGLPTTTPVPPTAVPPTSVPATVVPPTAVPPTTVPTEPPREERQQPTPTTVRPTAVPVVPGSPQLAILKSVHPSQVKVGEKATFTLRLTNVGDATARDVVVTDEIPAQLEVVDLKSSKGDIVLDGQQVKAYPRSIEPNELQTFEIVVRVRAGTTDNQIDNLALVTLGQPDDPGDNTSITTLLITPPDRTTLTTPRDLPRTSDPTAMGVWAQYWPLLLLAFCILGFGVATRQGAFQSQQMQVTVGSAAPVLLSSTDMVASIQTKAAGVTLDPHELLTRWQAGASTTELVELAMLSNPDANRVIVSIAVQQVLAAHLK